MGFNQVLTDWRKKGEPIEIIDSARKFCNSLRRLSRQVYNNIDKDPYISDSLRNELLVQGLKINIEDLDVLESTFRSFCYSHQCRGFYQSRVQNVTLGHVMTRNKIHQILEYARKAFTPKIHTLSIKRFLHKNSNQQRKLIRNIVITNRLTWSFYKPGNAANPFHNVSVNKDSLRRRLGLGNINPWVELVWFKHKLLKYQKAYIPTALDACMDDNFRPLGKTKPLIGKGGLNEIVHGALVGKQVVGKIEEAN